jgi:uncharacterized protein (TIGR03084 family)
MADLQPVLADLQAESQELDDLVAGLPADAWATLTPAEGWTIAHQIGHLAWTDEAAILAITDPVAFQEAMHGGLAVLATYVDDAATERAARPPAEVLRGWRDGRAALAEALLGVPAGERIVWFGPPMTATSMATARLMETWAHAGDVADALGVRRMPTPRLRHVAHLGVRTRDFAFFVNGRTPPADPVRVELTAPDGSLWEWGPSDAAQAVRGPALDFCLLVTQRANRGDLALEADGAEANAWLDIAQAFAGPPGAGRPATGRPATAS